MDGQRANLMRDYDAEKRRQAVARTVKPAPAKAAPAVSAAAKPAGTAQSAENKRLRAKVADQEAKLTKLREIAVEMSKRSARMSNVPGYVLKNYADELIKQLNKK